MTCLEVMPFVNTQQVAFCNLINTRQLYKSERRWWCLKPVSTCQAALATSYLRSPLNSTWFGGLNIQRATKQNWSHVHSMKSPFFSEIPLKQMLEIQFASAHYRLRLCDRARSSSELTGAFTMPFCSGVSPSKNGCLRASSREQRIDVSYSNIFSITSNRLRCSSVSPNM